MFDTLNVKYEYEKEGYDLGSAGWYLPDFWLPDQKCWVEIKGEQPDEIEQHRAFLLADMTCAPVVLCSGQVGAEKRYLSWTEHVAAHKTYVYLGYHSPSAFEICNDAFWMYKHQFDDGNLESFLSDHFPPDVIPHYDGTRSSVKALIELDRIYFRNKYGREHQHWMHGVKNKDCEWGWKDGLTLGPGYVALHPLLALAYNKGRSARFEHGERGR